MRYSYNLDVSNRLLLCELKIKFKLQQVLIINNLQTFEQYGLYMVHTLHRNSIHWLKHNRDLGHNDFHALLLCSDGHKLKPDKEFNNETNEKYINRS